MRTTSSTGASGGNAFATKRLTALADSGVDSKFLRACTVSGMVAATMLIREIGPPNEPKASDLRKFGQAETAPDSVDAGSVSWGA
jgi:hypothetical protein